MVTFGLGGERERGKCYELVTGGLSPYIILFRFLRPIVAVLQSLYKYYVLFHKNVLCMETITQFTKNLYALVFFKVNLRSKCIQTWFWNVLEVE